MQEELKLRDVNKTDWSNVGEVYKLDEDGQETMQDIAVSMARKGRESKSARASAKEFITVQKKKKAKFKFKNARHVLDAIEQAVRMKANVKKPTKPMKSSSADETV